MPTLAEQINAMKQQSQTGHQTKANEIAELMVKKKWNDYKISTCDYSGWDRKLHRDMPEIAAELRKLGFKTTSQVKWGVTDWYITL